MVCPAWDTGSQTDEYVYQPFFKAEQDDIKILPRNKGLIMFFVRRLFLTRHRLFCAQAAALPGRSSPSDKCTRYRSKSNMLTYGSPSFAATFASRVGLILLPALEKKGKNFRCAN